MKLGGNKGAPTFGRPLVTHRVLGVIGHVDHGKTALVRALTGTDTDRLPEEKQRGISIALGFAHLQAAPDTAIDLIDMPGHERFVRTMISGATGIDAVLLVVAANEGIKPQTVEHIHIASLLGLRHAVVAISKADLVSAERIEQVINEVMQLIRHCGFSAQPPVVTSVVHETGLQELRRSIEALLPSCSPRSSRGLAFLPIDRAFSVVGHGPVVTGTLRGGALTIADALDLLPLGRRVRIRSVQVHGANVTTALAGQRVGLNLRDVETAELTRGMVLASPGSLHLSNWLTLAIRSVDSAPPLKSGARLRALMGTSEVDARLRLLDTEVLPPGSAGFAQLHGTEPIALPAGEHVILRLASQTVAGGKVLEHAARRQRRHCPSTLLRLEDLHTLPPEAMLAAEVQRQGLKGLTLRELSHLSRLAEPQIVEMLNAHSVVITRSGLVLRRSDMDHLLSQIPALIASHPTGLSRNKLLAALPQTGRAVVDAALGRLLARNTIIERGSQLLIPQPDEDQARARNEEELATHIADTLRHGGLTPPNPKTVVTSAQSKRAIDRLLQAGIVVRAVDRAKDREILFHREAIEDAKRRLTPLLQTGTGLLVSEIATALGISRKYCMPLLDHLDTIHFTRRVDDRRILGGS